MKENAFSNSKLVVSETQENYIVKTEEIIQVEIKENIPQKEKAEEIFLTNEVQITPPQEKAESMNKLLNFFGDSLKKLLNKNEKDFSKFFTKINKKLEVDELTNEIGSINDLNFSEIKHVKEEDIPKLIDDSYLINNLVDPSFDNKSKSQYKTLQLIKLEQLRAAERKKLALEQKLSNLAENISKIKVSLLPETSPIKSNSLKHMILISDNIEATIKAERLVKSLNKLRKEKEEKKQRELQKLNEEIRNSIEEFKRQKDEAQERNKYYKQKNIFERLEKNEQKKQKLVSSSANNVKFLRKLFKSPKFYKKSSIIVDYPKNERIKEDEIFKNSKRNSNIKEIGNNNNYKNDFPLKKSEKLFKYQMEKKKNRISPKKKTDEVLLGKLEMEERILAEREKLIEQEKKIIHLRKEKFLEKHEKINKKPAPIPNNIAAEFSKNAAGDLSNKLAEEFPNEVIPEISNKIKVKPISHAENGRILIKKEHLQKREINKMIIKKIDEGIQAIEENIDETLKLI